MIYDDLFTEHAARARTTDPSTSHAAAASVNVPKSQRAVLAILSYLGRASDDTILAEAHTFDITMSPSRLRTARNELQRAGKVIDSGDRERLRSGRYAIVWTVAA